MGTLYYGSVDTSISIPDRLLAHLQAVLVTKLRRSETFTLSWTDAQKANRSTVWLHPAIPLRFEFEAAELVDLDRELLSSMAVAASSTRGLAIELNAAEDVASGRSATAAVV